MSARWRRVLRPSSMPPAMATWRSPWARAMCRRPATKSSRRCGGGNSGQGSARIGIPSAALAADRILDAAGVLHCDGLPRGEPVRLLRPALHAGPGRRRSGQVHRFHDPGHRPGFTRARAAGFPERLWREHLSDPDRRAEAQAAGRRLGGARFGFADLAEPAGGPDLGAAAGGVRKLDAGLGAEPELAALADRCLWSDP